MMKEFGEYFSSAGLSMNPSKSELVVFRKERQRAQMVAGAVRTKVERLSKVVPYMDWKNAK